MSKGLTALVALHNEDQAVMASLALESFGFKVDFANKVEMAVRLAQTNRYAGILTDINLESSGEATIEPGIRILNSARKSNPDVRTAFVSGNSENEILYNKLNEEVKQNTLYLPKPYSLERLKFLTPNI